MAEPNASKSTEANAPSNKYLFLLKPEVTSEQYLNIVLLANTLMKNGQTVEIATKAGSLDKFTSKLSLDSKIKIIHELPEQKALLQFPGQKESVKNIQWNQNKDQLNIYITMENGTFDSKNMEVIMMGESLAELLLVQTSSTSELGEFDNEKYKYIFTNKIASIGADLKDKDKDVDNICNEKHSALSEDSFDYLTKRAFKLDTDSLNLVLAGIMLATTNFKTNIKSPDTFITCAELLKSGATNEKAQKIVDALN